MRFSTAASGTSFTRTQIFTESFSFGFLSGVGGAHGPRAAEVYLPG
jgi:hypothetical protein